MEDNVKELPFEEKEVKEDYKAKQKKYRDMYKNRGKMVWVSKLPDRDLFGKKIKNPLNKGRTYVKKEQENVPMG